MIKEKRLMVYRWSQLEFIYCSTVAQNMQIIWLKGIWNRLNT